MERIKQAIEKANQQKQAAPAPAQRPTPLPVIPRVDGEPSAEIGVVSYDETRVVALDPVHLERNRIVAYTKISPNGGAIDLLRTQVLRKMEEHGWRTLAITSPSPESGKTMVSINLAMSIAHVSTKTALLVDFDLRRPKVGSYLGLPMEKSLNEVLAGRAEIPEALVNPGLPRLVVLPTRQPVTHSTEVLSSTKVSSLIAELRERYASRIIIFDLPPVLSTDDALAVFPKIDCILLVVANGLSSKKEIEESLHYIPPEKLLGTVYNKAEEAHKKYYY